MAKKKSIAKKLQDRVAEKIDEKVNPVKFAKNTAKGIGRVAKGLYDQVGAAGQGANAAIGSTNVATAINNPLNMLNPIGYAKRGFEKTRDLVTAGVRAVKGGIEMVKGLLNHKEWYLNYPVETLIGLNYGRRKSIKNDIYDLLNMNGETLNSRNGLETTVSCSLRTKFVIPKDEQNTFFQAITILYQKIRAANAGAINYTPADLAAYILNVRSLRGAVTYIKKVIGSINYVDPYDADLPQKLVDGALYPVHSGSNYIGVNYETVAANRADLINSFNLWVNQLNTLLPLRLDLFERTKWLTTGIFKDSDDVKANIYQFLITEFPIFTVSSNVVSNTDAVHLRNTSTTGFDANYIAMVKSITNTINTVVSAPVNVIIAGDILKAFGQDAFDIIDHIDANFVQCPIYDESVLTQIQNIVCCGSPDDEGTSALSANFSNNTITDVIVYSSSTHMDMMATQNQDSILTNSNTDVIDAGKQLSLTRLQPHCTWNSSTYQVTIVSCGTEVVVGKLITNDTQNTYKYVELDYVGTSSAGGETARTINAWAILDYAPFTMVRIYDKNATTYQVATMFDYNNFAISKWDVIDVMHQYATLSLMASKTYVKKQSEFRFQR